LFFFVFQAGGPLLSFRATTPMNLKTSPTWENNCFALPTLVPPLYSQLRNSFSVFCFGSSEGDFFPEAVTPGFLFSPLCFYRLLFGPFFLFLVPLSFFSSVPVTDLFFRVKLPFRRLGPTFLMFLHDDFLLFFLSVRLVFPPFPAARGSRLGLVLLLTFSPLFTPFFLSPPPDPSLQWILLPPRVFLLENLPQFFDWILSSLRFRFKFCL